MRLQRGTPVAGIDPQLARDLARAVHLAWTSTERVAARIHRDLQDAEEMLSALETAGYLASRPVPPQFGGGFEWGTTARGGALTMASFLPPISRGRAQTLVEQLLQRVARYNADQDMPLVISQIGVFGSYLDTAVEHLGDVDITTILTRRAWIDEPGRRSAYARRSGRRFNTLLQELTWPEEEARRVLKNRSPYFNVHEEDISRFTDQHRVIYQVPPQP